MQWEDLRLADQNAEIFEGDLQELLDISAYHAYEVLRSHFGLPTINETEGIGYLTFWLASEETIITVDMVSEGYLAGLEEIEGVYLSGVGIMAEDKTLKKTSDVAKRDLKAFVRLLINDVEKHSKKNDKKIKSIIENSNKSVLQNPFQIYFSSAREVFDRAKKSQTHHRDEAPFLQASFFLFTAAFEGFINLIYELYLDENLSKERGVIDRINRLNIDLKILLAPRFCVCFENNIIENDEIFKRYKSIIDLRNNYVHANVVEPMRYVVHEVDNLHFLINREHQSKNAYGLPKNVSELFVKDIEFVEETISEMIKKITDAMSPLYRIDFLPYLSNDYVIKVLANE